MTFREKLQMERPDCISLSCGGGCQGCPGSHGYEPRDYCYAKVNNLPIGEDACRKCWDREIPGTTCEEKVTKMIRDGNLADLDFGDLQEAMRDPARYKLTFGQVARICRVLQDLVKANNEACATQTTEYQKKVNAELRKKNRELEVRVKTLEEKLDRLSSALCEEKGE